VWYLFVIVIVFNLTCWSPLSYLSRRAIKPRWEF